MSLSESQALPSPSIRQVFCWVYGFGMALCVVWPLVLQGMIGRQIQPGLLDITGMAQELGYSFTLLVAFSGLYVVRRSRKAISRFADLPEAKRPRAMALEILLYSALFELSTLLGLVYLAMGGPQAERYARTFVALSPIMFLLFVPGLSKWQKTP